MLKHVILNVIFCVLGCALLVDDILQGEVWMAALGAVVVAFNGSVTVIALLTANDLEPRG